jgi:ribosomal protein L15E
MHLNGARGPATTTAKHGKSPDRVYYDKDGLTEAGKKARGIKTQKKEKASA